MEKVDLLSDEALAKLFKQYDGDEDAVLEYLRENLDGKADISNGDLQGVVEAFEIINGLN